MSTLKTYAQLLEELKWLGPGVVYYLMATGNTRQCGHVSGEVAQYLRERGFFVSSRGAGRYSGHFDFSVQTGDQGWISVDPTAVQFHLPNSPSHALQIAKSKGYEADTKEEKIQLIQKVFEPTIAWSVQALRDGVSAFEVARAPHITSASLLSAESPPYSATWRQHWQERLRDATAVRAGVLLEDSSVRFEGRPAPGYWEEQVVARFAAETARKNPKQSYTGKRTLGASTKFVDEVTKALLEKGHFEGEVTRPDGKVIPFRAKTHFQFGGNPSAAVFHLPSFYQVIFVISWRLGKASPRQKGQLRSVVAHELTHLLDPTPLGRELIGQETAEDKRRFYYNRPTEVTAYRHQIVFELERAKARLRPGQDIVPFLHKHSTTWREIEPWLTDTSRRRILESVYVYCHV